MVKYKRNDSESDGAPQPEQVFRISVCLKQFFSDERALACVQVNGTRPVRWLARRLRRAFPLPRALRLLSRGHLLPPDEPLALLERDDLVQVVPVLDCAPQPGDEADSSHFVTPKTVLEESTVRAPARSSSPDRPASPYLNNLLEGKRRAIQLLEQYCGGEGQDHEHMPPGPALHRARRRRVRRRRRTALPLISDDLIEHRDASCVSVGVVIEADGITSAGDENGETSAAGEVAADTENAAVGSAGEVLRNASPARAPRVVRPLALSA